MENEENNDNLEGQVGANAGIAGAENQDQLQNSNESTQPTWQEQAIAHAKSQGREIETIDELFKPIEVEKEVVKEVNPYDKFITEDDKAFYKYAEETGRTRKEFEALNLNYDSIPSLELARERVRKEYGATNITDAQIDSFLERELGIELEELDDYGEIKLSGYAKTVRDERKAEQAKYRQPIENKTEPKQESTQQEYVPLPNGGVMRKVDYEAALVAKQKHNEEAVKAVKSVIPATFKFSVDDNGSVTDVPITYEYHEQDLQRMESIVSDVQGTMDKRYLSEQGFNHASFAEDMVWSDPEFRGKAISDIVTKARAQAIEEVMKSNGNHSFNNHKSLPRQTQEGIKMVDAAEAFGFKR